MCKYIEGHFSEDDSEVDKEALHIDIAKVHVCFLLLFI